MWGNASTRRIPAANSPLTKFPCLAEANITTRVRRRDYCFHLAIAYGSVITEGANHVHLRHAFIHPSQHACCAATPIRPLQDLRNHTEYVRRITSWSEPSMCASRDSASLTFAQKYQPRKIWNLQLEPHHWPTVLSHIRAAGQGRWQIEDRAARRACL